MKKILIGLLATCSLSAFAQDRFYDCVPSGDLEQYASLIAEVNRIKMPVYDFGGAVVSCHAIASKLNVQLITKGVPRFYDCENPVPEHSRHYTIVSDLGEVITTRWSGYICTQLALNLNKTLR